MPGSPLLEPVGGPLSVLVAVGDASAVGEARRAALALGAQAALDETTQGSLALLATESATNLARHAREGMLLLRLLERDGAPAGVELLALDRGPGIADVAQALTDGYSTGGTAGHGLGAMRRLAHEFDLYSQPGAGTAIVMRLWSRAGRREDGAAAAAPGMVGAVCVPVRGERVCGDGWTVVAGGGFTVAAVVDGLGHGPDAARAAEAALGAVRANAGAAPAEVVRLAHGPLRATRGAALAVARLEHGGGVVRFAGVGNISGVIATPGTSRSMASHNGIVGHEMRKVQEFTYDWPAGATLLLHSDGVQTRWRLDAYPGLLTRDAALVAGVLYRDFARGRDDATVLVLPAHAAG